MIYKVFPYVAVKLNMTFMDTKRIILQHKLWYNPFFAFYEKINLLYRKVRVYIGYEDFNTQKIIQRESLNEYFSEP